MSDRWDGYDHPAMIDYEWEDLCRRADEGYFDDVIFGFEPPPHVEEPRPDKTPDSD